MGIVGIIDYGVIDDLVMIVDVVEKYVLWMYVDSVYGGVLILSSYKDCFNGIECV